MGWHFTWLLGRNHDPDPDHIQSLRTDAAREKQSILIDLNAPSTLPRLYIRNSAEPWL